MLLLTCHISLPSSQPPVYKIHQEGQVRRGGHERCYCRRAALHPDDQQAEEGQAGQAPCLAQAGGIRQELHTSVIKAKGDRVGVV